MLHSLNEEGEFVGESSELVDGTPQGVAGLFGEGAQLVLGRETLWLPERIRRRTVSGKVISSFTCRIVPALVRLESILKPRYSLLAGSELANRLTGIVAFPLALILLLPLPFLHMLPGAAMTCLAVALAERDGLAAAAQIRERV